MKMLLIIKIYCVLVATSRLIDAIASAMAASSVLKDKRRYHIDITIGRYSKLMYWYHILKSCIDQSLQFTKWFRTTHFRYMTQNH